MLTEKTPHELRQRLQKFGLELHPQKTRIIEFGRFAERNRKAQGLGKPKTFAFLGFTHICGTSRSGGYLILRHTIRQRLREKLRQVKETIGRLMHRPVAEQGLYLKQVMNGFFNYFAVPTNSRAINSFYRHVAWYWCRALRRRGQISRLTWQRMKRLIDYWLPPARIRHPLPRRAVQHHDPRWEPSAVVPLAGICAGGGEQSPSLPRHFEGRR
jgi:RNA-directed DNA polymerase